MQVSAPVASSAPPSSSSAPASVVAPSPSYCYIKETVGNTWITFERSGDIYLAKTVAAFSSASPVEFDAQRNRVCMTTTGYCGTSSNAGASAWWFVKDLQSGQAYLGSASFDYGHWTKDDNGFLVDIVQPGHLPSGFDGAKYQTDGGNGANRYIQLSAARNMGGNTEVAMVYVCV